MTNKALAVVALGLSLMTEVARACEVNPNVLHRWRRELQDYGTKAFAGNGQRRADESQVAELERKVGRQALEIDWCADRTLEICEQRARAVQSGGRSSSASLNISLELWDAAVIYAWRNASAARCTAGSNAISQVGQTAGVALAREVFASNVMSKII